MDSVKASGSGVHDLGNSWGDLSEPSRVSGQWIGRGLFLIALLGMIGLVAAIELEWRPTNKQSRIARPPEKQIFDGVSYDNFSVKQTVLETPSGPVLIQHYPRHLEEIPKFNVLQGEIASLHFDVDNPWYEGFNQGKFLATFNCGAFAVGFDIELSPADVLDAVPLYGYPNALEVILLEYYKSIGSINRNDPNQEFSIDRNLGQEGDLMCLIKSDEQSREHVHIARVQSVRGDEIMFLSKMGRRGPIMSTNLQFLLRHYPETNKLEFYRVKSNGT